MPVKCKMFLAVQLILTTNELLWAVKKTEITAVGICHANHVTPLYQLKSTLTSPTGGGHSVSIVHSRTQAMELVNELL
jgi:hypothetical protein